LEAQGVVQHGDVVEHGVDAPPACRQAGPLRPHTGCRAP
jgi:hypothetical protein